MAKEKNAGKRRAPRATARSGKDTLNGARAPGAKTRVLRIIAGRHRGRRLRFPAGVEIRPTPDRVRETLFNWLQPRIQGARVLDLFAGSGALGLEALSRGAGEVTFIEQDRRAVAAIDTLLKEWGETAGRTVCADALSWLAATGAAFDIVFLDPPYDADLLAAAAERLSAHGRLNADSRIYVERRARDTLAALPASWRELRSGQAGEVGYHLFAV